MLRGLTSGDGDCAELFRRRFRDDSGFHCGTTVHDGRDFDLQKQKTARDNALSTFELLLLLRR